MSDEYMYQIFRGMEDIITPGAKYWPGDRHQIQFLVTLKRWIKRSAFNGGYAIVNPSATYHSATLTEETLGTICRQIKDACFRIFDLIVTMPTEPALSVRGLEYDRIPESSMHEAIKQIYGIDMMKYSQYFMVYNEETCDDDFDNQAISHFAYLWCTVREQEHKDNFIEFTLFFNSRTLSVLGVFIALHLQRLFGGRDSAVFTPTKLDVVCLSSVCSNCMKTDVKLSACASRCSRTLYCSRECQRAHWKMEHKSICEEMPAPGAVLCYLP